MSSSKVFRKDPHFTPTTLISRNIAPARKESGSPVAETPSLSKSAPPSPQTEQPNVKASQVESKPAPLVDVEAIKKEAYNKGKADQVAQFHRELQQTVAAFAEACRKFDNQRKVLLQHNRADLINLIILLSEKILGQELATPRNVIATTLQSALEQAIESEEYYVTLHPEDLAFAEAKVPELIAAIRGLERIVFKTDDTMARGGCLLESAVCTVDASIATQLDSMKDFLTEQPLFAPIPDTEKSLSPGQTDEESAPQP
jgi:flagellar assembly protein FliH